MTASLKFPFPPPGSSGSASPANSSTVRLVSELWPGILPKPCQSLQSPNPEWCPALWDWEEARMGDTGWCTPTEGPWRVSRTKYILHPGEEARQRRKFSSFHSSTARMQHSLPAPQMLFLPNLQPLGWKQLPLLPLLSAMHAGGPDPHQQNLVLPCDRDKGPKHAVPTLNQAREAQHGQTLSAALPVTCLRMAEQGWAPLGPPRLRWSPSTTQGPPKGYGPP